MKKRKISSTITLRGGVANKFFNDLIAANPPPVLTDDDVRALEDLEARGRARGAVLAAALAWHELPIHSNIEALKAACAAYKSTALVGLDAGNH